MNKKIGIIGFGNMGAAIAGSLKDAYDIIVYDKDKQKSALAKSIKVAASPQDLLQKTDSVILAVKPQDIENVLYEIKGKVEAKSVISIAAGISTGYIEKILGDVEVIRAMPNLPAKIGKGVTGICAGKFAGDALKFATDLFSKLGQVLTVEEKMMDAVTAVSGSGPAYVCAFLESKHLKPSDIPAEAREIFLNEFQQAAENVGFNKKDAALLTEQTFSGTIAYLHSTQILPAELKKQVASKGGTTEAALQILENGGLLKEAVVAALLRSQALARRG